MPCVARIRTHCQDRDASLSDRKGKAKKKRSSPKRVFLTKGEIIYTKITLQIEDFIHGFILTWHTHTCARQQSHENSCSKNSSGQRVGQVTNTASVK